jgi:LysM repeat protein
MWTKIINMLKRFGTGRQLDFELVDDDEMPYEMEKRKEMKKMKRNIKEDQSFLDRIKRLTSLDSQNDSDIGDDAAEFAAGFVPGVQQAMSARDFERARREGDLTGMGVAAASGLPFVGGFVRGARGASKLGKVAKKALGPTKKTDDFDKIPPGPIDFDIDKPMQWSRRDPTGPLPDIDPKYMGRTDPTGPLPDIDPKYMGRTDPTGPLPDIDQKNMGRTEPTKSRIRVKGELGSPTNQPTTTVVPTKTTDLPNMTPAQIRQQKQNPAIDFVRGQMDPKSTSTKTSASTSTAQTGQRTTPATAPNMTPAQIRQQKQNPAIDSARNQMAANPAPAKTSPSTAQTGQRTPTATAPASTAQTGQRTPTATAPTRQPVKVNPAVVAATAAGTVGLGTAGLSLMDKSKKEPTVPAAPASTPASSVTTTAPDVPVQQPPKTTQQTSQSVNQLAQMNNIADPNKIRVGQVITLPSGQRYTIAKGDTLWGISRGQFKNPQMAPKTPPTTARSQSAPTLPLPSSPTVSTATRRPASTQTSYSSSDLPTPRMGPVKESYLKEGYHAINKKMSYNDAIPEVKLVIHHSKVLENEDVRYRNIEKIYIENAHGEKILSPSRSVGLSKIYARILAEGDKPYCDKWNHVTQIVEDYIKLSRFARATKNVPFNEGAQRLIDSSNMHLQGLRESLKKLSSYRGFHNYFDNWSPILNENSEESIDLSEMFLNQSLDPRIEDALPILSKLGTKLIESDLPVVEELIQWSDNLEESLNKPKLGYGEIPSKYGKLGRGITVKPKQHDKSAKTVDDINKPDKASLLPGSRFRDIPY